MDYKFSRACTIARNRELMAETFGPKRSSLALDMVKSRVLVNQWATKFRTTTSIVPQCPSMKKMGTRQLSTCIHALISLRLKPACFLQILTQFNALKTLSLKPRQLQAHARLKTMSPTQQSCHSHNPQSCPSPCPCPLSIGCLVICVVATCSVRATLQRSFPSLVYA